MLYQDPMVEDLILEKFTMQIEVKAKKTKHADLFRYWESYFSPLGNPKKQIGITINWAPFFTINLLKKDNFLWANFFLNSLAWQVIQQEETTSESLNFSIPLESPKIAANCSATKIEQQSPPRNKYASITIFTPEQEEVLDQQSSSITHLMP
jgi:hypothetical protein